MTRTTLSPLVFVVACLPVLLAGCGQAGPTPTPWIVTATPDVPTSTPTPVASPTLEPSPTPVPDIALRTAQLHLTNGDYEAAVLTFQSVLSQPADAVTADVRASAAYGLGEAALREGLFQETANALTSFLAQYPADGRVPQAYFMRGDAMLGLGQWQPAIIDFQQYLALRPGVIDSYALERIGDAYLAQGLTAEALTAYGQAIDAGRGLVPLLALRERVAQVYLNVGRPLDAVAQYDAILTQAENDGYRAEIMLLAGQALAVSGDTTGAYQRFQALLSAYPETEYAYQALTRLLEAGQAVDPARWARIAAAAQDYQGAISALYQLTSQVALADIPADVHLLLGRAYRETGNSSAAMTAFQTILDQYPTSPEFGAALLEQGRTAFLSGDVAGAIRRYQSLVDTYPQLPEAPEALWRVGYLYETQNQPAESLAAYERLGREYPGNEWAMNGLLRAATAAIKRGETATAERLLANLGATGAGPDVASAYLWLGKLALQGGNTTQAQTALQAATAADPGGYFSIRAEDLLLGRAMFQPPAAYRFEFDNQLELGQAEDWLRATFGITQTDALWPMSAELQADPRVVAGAELWALQAVNEAGEEFSSLLDDHKFDPLTSYQLAIWLRGIGVYTYSIVGAANILKAANVETLDAPPYLARMRYPAFYSDLVLPEAQARGIDPLLLFALIRQESLFDRYATAAAGEKGLTQVIPSTADYIARQLAWPNYQPTVLFRPYASVAFGAYYLWEQLNRFDFNPPVALAAYNAGPGNAAAWLETAGSDPDLFMEAIAFSGTRLYVQRIYEHYQVYRQLYGAG